MSETVSIGREVAQRRMQLDTLIRLAQTHLGAKDVPIESRRVKTVVSEIKTRDLKTSPGMQQIQQSDLAPGVKAAADEFKGTNTVVRRDSSKLGKAEDVPGISGPQNTPFRKVNLEDFIASEQMNEAGVTVVKEMKLEGLNGACLVIFQEVDENGDVFYRPAIDSTQLMDDDGNWLNEKARDLWAHFEDAVQDPGLDDGGGVAALSEEEMMRINEALKEVGLVPDESADKTSDNLGQIVTNQNPNHKTRTQT